MTDIVEKLKGVHYGSTPDLAFKLIDLCDQAADEIERLRETIKDLKEENKWLRDDLWRAESYIPQ